MNDTAFAYDVFLSHSSQDKAIVLPLAQRLKEDGLRVWFDDWEIRPGDSIPVKIEEGLERSRVLVLCMSARAFGSDWATLESQTFRFRDPLNRDRRFVPLRLDDTPAKGSLGQFAYVDWRGDAPAAEYGRLLEACRQPTVQPTSEQDTAGRQFAEKVLSLGHTSGVKSVAFSPDGRQVLSGSFDQTARVWEVDSGHCLCVLEGHSGPILCVAWSQDGRQALSGSMDQTVRVWEVDSGRCLRVLEGHSASVASVAWNVDGRRAISGSQDRSVRLWEVDSGLCLRVLEGHSAPIVSVAWNVDGRHALSGSLDKTVRLWDIDSGRCLRVLEGHSDDVWSVAWSADGRHALSGSDDQTLRVWEVDSGRCLRVLEGHSTPVVNVAWTADGRLAVSGSVDETSRLWEVESGRCVRVFEGPSVPILSVAWTADGRLAVSGSVDETSRLWEVESGRCLRMLEGHSSRVLSVAWSADGRQALSGSEDKTVRLWEVDSGRRQRVLEGHSSRVLSVAWSADGRRALSGSDDKTVRLWEVDSGRCLRVFKGHSGGVNGVAWSADGRQALSGSSDQTMRLWEVDSGRCLRVLEGHSSRVLSVAWSGDGRQALSGSNDQTVRLWEVDSGRCLRVLEGHSDSVWSVAWSADGQAAFSAAENGVMRVWNLRELPAHPHPDGRPEAREATEPDQLQYTNAKVLLVGDSGAGKTGLAGRLVQRRFIPSDSTSGTWSTQWLLPGLSSEQGLDREIWLWDFGGQADQRLVHQLYMDKTALILLLFDADKEDVLPGLREWQQALRNNVSADARRVLVAGRTDAGFRGHRERIKRFAEENGYLYFETSAREGWGCDDLEQGIVASIPWDHIEKRTSPRLYKTIKDEILQMRDEGHMLVTCKELQAILRQRLPAETSFTQSTLETVVGLLDGPGVVKELDFGTYVLLRPEWINAYAQAVIRTLRADDRELGCLPLRSIAEGQLIFQTRQADGEIKEEKRLPEGEERVVLQAMEQTMLERSLCLRQDDQMVFPSHCGRERPEVQRVPAVFVSYRFQGFLDDVYATLVVRLVHCGAFPLRDLWRDAADFETLADGGRVGIKLTRDADGQGELEIYCEHGVTAQEQVIFANYIHEHLKTKAAEVARLRHYVCPHCGTPMMNREVAMRRLAEQGEAAGILCVDCEQRVPLWDEMEQRFASPEVREQVRSLQVAEAQELDGRRKAKLLVDEVSARIHSADQKCFEIPGAEDEGLDMELEFTDENGQGTGRRMYLQLKAGNSHLRRRKRDGAEVFQIKKQRWVQYWMDQPWPVMLVIGTFPEEEDRRRSGPEARFASIRWMEIRDWLKREADNGRKEVRQIIFEGQRLDLTSVRHWRDRVLGH